MMTMFIQLEDGTPSGHPILEDNFRVLFPNTSFPRYFTAGVVEPLGYGVYDFSNQPEPSRYEKVIEITPVRSDAGIWRQTWAVVAMDDAEKVAADELKAEQVRNERNWILLASDWVVVKSYETGEVVPAAWVSYRQSIRDITTQEGFPYSVIWPTKPNF
jgi:hypothetical protein